MSTETNKSTEFIANIIKNSTNQEFIDELGKVIDADLKVCDLDAGTLGCAYSYGSFLVDGDHREIYRKKYPLYYQFLHEWYHK